MKRFSLDRSKVIRRASEFNDVFTTGRRLSSANLTVFFKSSPGSRFGFAVSKRAGNAVTRNFIKRRLREFIRQHPDILPDNADVIILGRTGVTRLRFQRLGEEIVNLLKKVQRAVNANK